MSANSGPLVSTKADSASKASKASYDHVDINKLYKGKTSETVTKTVAQKQGMQAFGKPLAATRPGHVGSLKSENCTEGSSSLTDNQNSSIRVGLSQHHQATNHLQPPRRGLLSHSPRPPQAAPPPGYAVPQFLGILSRNRFTFADGPHPGPGVFYAGTTEFSGMSLHPAPPRSQMNNNHNSDSLVAQDSSHFAKNSIIKDADLKRMAEVGVQDGSWRNPHPRGFGGKPHMSKLPHTLQSRQYLTNNNPANPLTSPYQAGTNQRQTSCPVAITGEDKNATSDEWELVQEKQKEDRGKIETDYSREKREGGRERRNYDYENRYGNDQPRDSRSYKENEAPSRSPPKPGMDSGQNSKSHDAESPETRKFEDSKPYGTSKLKMSWADEKDDECHSSKEIEDLQTRKSKQEHNVRMNQQFTLPDYYTQRSEERQKPVIIAKHQTKVADMKSEKIEPVKVVKQQTSPSVSQVETKKPVNELEKKKGKLTDMPHPTKGRFRKPVQLEKLMWKKLFKIKQQEGSAAALQAGWPAAPAEEVNEDANVSRELSYSPKRLKVPAPTVVTKVRRTENQRLARSLQTAGVSGQTPGNRDSWRWVELDRRFHKQVLAASILNWKLPHPEEDVVLAQNLGHLDASKIRSEDQPPEVGVMWIADYKSFSKMVRDLADAPLLYLDMEFCNQNSYIGFISLIQISAGGCVYLLDPLSLLQELTNEFKDLLESTRRTLIMFGSENDILFLRKHLRIFPTRLLDLQLVDQYIVGGQPRGLGKVLAERLGIQSGVCKEELQRSNWTTRPLSEEQILYAIEDVKNLPDLLSSFLSEVDGGVCASEGFEASKRTLLRLPKPKKPKSLTQELRHVNARKAIRFSNDQMDVVRNLFLYRAWRAESIDLEPHKVLPIQVIVQIALSPPLSVDQLDAKLKHLPALDPVHQLIFQIIIDGGVMIQRMKCIVCNNCLLEGHLARFCPYPSGTGRPRMKEIQYNYWQKKQDFQRYKAQKREDFVNSKLRPHCQGWRNKTVEFGLEVNRLEVGDRDSVRFEIKKRCIVISWGEVRGRLLVGLDFIKFTHFASVHKNLPTNKLNLLKHNTVAINNATNHLLRSDMEVPRTN